MASRSAVLSIRVVSDAKDAQKGMDQTASGVEKFERGLGKASRRATVALGAIGLGAAGAALKAEELASANSRLDAVLENQGMDHASERVQAYAESLERSLGIDEKTTKAAQAKLGTFSAVAASADEAGGAFDRATMASIDLAASGFGSIEDNSVQLGKALQDPVKGLGSLAKAGVSFTDAEREMIEAMVEANDVAGAQDIVLSAIEGQVGGVAAATADSSEIMKLAWGDVVEQLGMALLPALDTLGEVLPQIADLVIEHSDVVLASVAVVAGLAAGIIALNAAMKVYRATVIAVTIVTKAFRLAQIALNLAMRANPIGIIITIIGALIAVVVKLWKENEGFRNFFITAWKVIEVTARIVWEAIKTAVGAVVGWITERVRKYKAVTIAVWTAIRDAGKKVWEKVKDAGRKALDFLLNPIEAVQSAFDAVWSVVESVIAAIKRIVFPSMPGWMRDLGGSFSTTFSAPEDDGLMTRTLTSEADSTQQLTAPAMFGSSSGLSSLASSSSGPQINITINGAMDPAAVGRQIERYVGKSLRASGRRSLGQVTFA